MAITTGRPTTTAAPPEVVEPRRLRPVVAWAVVGAAVLAFEVFVLARWVSGPLFETVPVGPSDPPTFMKVAMVVFQATCIPAALFCLYWFVVRPWRRDGKLGTDGALVIAFATLWFQDPLSAYSGHWFTYNSWALNFGSWVNSVPGALGAAKPGAMLVEPLLVIPGVYVWVFVLTMFFGAAVMRRIRARFPRMGVLGLSACCVLVMWAFDVVFEGIIFLPLGIWEYPGGHLALFPDTYHKFPLNEMVTVGTLFAVVACIRFFTDDRGETLAERGLHQLRFGERGKGIVRALAMIGVAHVALFAIYNLPNSWVATHSTAWPADLQERSYLTDGICGAGTDTMCPGPAVPQIRNDNGNPNGGSAHLDPQGRLVVPRDTQLPPPVPFR
jgi:hypothetical protein